MAIVCGDPHIIKKVCHLQRSQLSVCPCVMLLPASGAGTYKYTCKCEQRATVCWSQRFACKLDCRSTFKHEKDRPKIEIYSILSKPAKSHESPSVLKSFKCQKPLNCCNLNILIDRATRCKKATGATISLFLFTSLPFKHALLQETTRNLSHNATQLVSDCSIYCCQRGK